MPRQYRQIEMATLEVRIPLMMKDRLNAFALTTGQSQQAVIRQALDRFLKNWEDFLRGEDPASARA